MRRFPFAFLNDHDEHIASTTHLDSTPDGATKTGDTEDAQDEVPWHLQMVNILSQLTDRRKELIRRYAALVEEIGVFYVAANNGFVAGSVVATQGTSFNVLVHEVSCSFDTSITSYILTLGNKTWQFNSAGTDGTKTWTMLNLRLSPGDVRSLVPVSGTPSHGTLYICGENVRVN